MLTRRFRGVVMLAALLTIASPSPSAAAQAPVPTSTSAVPRLQRDAGPRVAYAGRGCFYQGYYSTSRLPRASVAGLWQL